tara:strand:+ start:9577 stop:10107 length:531 start_codon:yes stop_codon:yes gene_type:complete
MIWVLGFCITFFSLLCGGLLVRSTSLSKNIIWLIGLLIIPAVLLYLHLGNPLLPDHPYHKIQQLSTPKETIDAFNEIKTRQEIIQITPKNDTAWFELGRLYQKTRQFYKAALVYREAWKLTPASYDYKFAYTQALIFFNNGKLSATTLKLLKELHKENPGDNRISVFLTIGHKDVG